MAAIAPSMANINLDVVAPYEVTISIAIITATAVFIVLKPIRNLLYFANKHIPPYKISL